MGVGWVPCASRLVQKRRIKTAISPPTQRKRPSGGAASAGGRPSLCRQRICRHSASLGGTAWAEASHARKSAKMCFFPFFLVTGWDSRWTLNILKRQETLKARTRALQLPISAAVTSKDSPSPSYGPPSAHHLVHCQSLLRGLRAIYFTCSWAIGLDAALQSDQPQ